MFASSSKLSDGIGRADTHSAMPLKDEQV